MITAGQLRASRAILGIDQRKLAEAAGLSLPASFAAMSIR